MRHSTGWWTAAAVLCGLRLASGQVEEAQTIEVQVQAESGAAKTPPHERGAQFQFFLSPTESQFAIGVALEDLPESLKAQLKLERGVVVGNVMEMSPAAKAGVQKNDLILSAAGADVKTPADLMAAVAKAETNSLALVLLRGGKEQTVEVKPDARERIRLALPAGAGGLDDLTRTFEKALPHSGPPVTMLRQGNELILVHPGVMLNRLSTNALPEGVKLTVSKEGDQPAKITVQKGEQKWEATEDKLDTLPEEFRGTVKKALSREGRIEMAIEGTPGKVAAVAAEKIHADKVHAETVRRKLQDAEQKVLAIRTKSASEAEARLESKLDEVLKRLSALDRSRADQLQKQVDELREQVEALKKQAK